MSNRNLILFDWDGTLADSMPLCIGEIREALEEMGHAQLPEELIRQCNGPTDEESVQILGLTPEEGPVFMRLRQAAGLRLVTKIQKFFPGIRETLEKLAETYDLAVVSNGIPEYLDLSIQYLNCPLFTVVEGFQQGRTKTQAVQEVLDRLKPGCAVMVGDRISDFEAAHGCGVPVIAAKYGYGNAQEWATADLCVETASELPDAVANLMNKGG